MQYGKIYLLFFLFLGLCYSAQFESMLNKKYRDKVFPIQYFYAKNIRIAYPEAKKKSEELKTFGKKHHDISLEAEADLYLAYYHIFHHIGTEKEQINTLLKVAEHGKKKKMLDIEARAIKVLRDYYWFDKKNYEIGFEYGLRLDRILKRTNATDFPDFPEYYFLIGSSYYLFRDYDTSIKYFKKILQVPENSFNWKSYWNAANTLGLCYQKLNKTDSSDYYLKKAVASKFIKKESIQYSISIGNFAYNLYRKGKFSEAQPLFQIDISNALKIGDYGLATGSMIPLADIYIYEGKTKEALELLKKSESYIRKSGQKERLENFYPIMSHWYEDQNMKQEAILYKDSSIIAANNNNNIFNGLMLLRVQQKIDRQKLEEEEKNREIKTILFFIFLTVIAVFAVLYYFYQKKIYTEKNRTKEAELKLSTEKLENAKQEINNFLKEIDNKNQLIEQLINIDDSTQNREAIEKIKRTAILTDEDWDKFKSAFERINPGYIDRLNYKINGITPAEIRMVVLSKLSLSHKEIANILGISPQSSRVTWHRLKKKMNLEDSVSLQDLADEI